MNIKSGKFSVRLVACSAVSVSLLAACSLGAPGGPPDPEGGQETTGPAGVRVDHPKDAGAAEACSLLPQQGAESLGLGPQGESSSSSFGEDNDNSCTWKSPDGSVYTSLSVFSDRTLQDYYANPAEFVDFEKLNIAGHPAVRANRGDPKSGGTCSFFLASKADQVIQSTSQVPAAQTSSTDPCDLAKKTLESAVPSWPAAK